VGLFDRTRHWVRLGKCGIDRRGRGKKLKINYRTTDEIRRVAVRLLVGRPIDDLDGGTDDQKGYMSLTHGTTPEVKVLRTSVWVQRQLVRRGRWRHAAR
jgi:hypothetical protein